VESGHEAEVSGQFGGSLADGPSNDRGKFRRCWFDRLNKTLFVFASYNAGPNRIARLRKQAQAQGLDPNVWFDNVELVVAKDIGQKTVTCVGNVYKYYVAYKRATKQAQVRQKAKQGSGT
jgi:membrane-bound lytic murein transglycosylase MltF